MARSDDEHLKELLSSYLDGCVDQETARKVEALLAQRPELAAYLDELTSQRQLLHEVHEFVIKLRQVHTENAATAFSERVLAELRQRRLVEPAPLTSAVTDSSSPSGSASEPVQVARRQRLRNQPAWFILSASAAILVIVAGVTWWLLGSVTPESKMADSQVSSDAVSDTERHEPAPRRGPGVQGLDGGTELAGTGQRQVVPSGQAGGAVPDVAPASGDSEPTASPESPQYVSELDFSRSFVFIVDVELSPEATSKGLFQQLLRSEGIDIDAPIVANEDIAKAITETRMIVQQGSDSDAFSDAMIYFVRASLDQLGPVLDKIYFDRENFPRVSFDLAIDNPTTRLMQKIARRTGRRYAVSDSFAAPLQPQDARGGASAYVKVRTPQRYVSAVERERGFSEQGFKAAIPASDMNNVLFIVRPSD